MKTRPVECLSFRERSSDSTDPWGIGEIWHCTFLVWNVQGSSCTGRNKRLCRFSESWRWGVIKILDYKGVPLPQVLLQSKVYYRRVISEEVTNSNERWEEGHTRQYWYGYRGAIHGWRVKGCEWCDLSCCVISQVWNAKATCELEAILYDRCQTRSTFFPYKFKRILLCSMRVV